MRNPVAGRHHGRGRGGFGGAVAVAHLQFRKSLGKTPDARFGHGRTAVGAYSPAAEIKAREVWLQQAQAVHGGHHQRMRDAFLLGQQQKLAALEFRHHHQRAAHVKERHEHTAQPGHMRPGYAEQGALVARQVVRVFPVQAGMHDVQVRQHRALGFAGRARGVQNAEDVLLADRGQRCGRCMARVQQRPPFGAAAGKPHRCRRAGVRQFVGEFSAVNQRHWLRVFKDVADLGAPQARAQGHQDGAQTGNRDHAEHGFEPVGEHDGDPLALLYAARHEVCSERCRPCIEFAKAYAQVAINHRHLVGGQAMTALQHVVDVRRTLCVAAHQSAPMEFLARDGHGSLPWSI